MTSAFIISEYKWEHRKQLLLEKLLDGGTGYRVIIVKRCKSLNAAKQAFLAEIPKDRKDYFSKVVEDYAMRNGIKLTQKTRTAPVRYQKGTRNVQSKRKGA